MAKNNHYTITKEINGTEYTAQFAGISVALKATDETHIDGSDATSVEKMADYLFQHVIVEPKGLTPDDFDTIEEFQEVIKFASGVMKGEFRNQAVNGTAEKTSKK